MKINLVYMSDNPFGGWVTFTAHLLYGLQAHTQVELFKIRNRSEKTSRKFGYGLSYRNVSSDELLDGNDLTIVTALHKNKIELAVQLLKRKNTYIVIHDPNEFYLLDRVDASRVITIRKSVHNQLSGSLLIRHPYQRTFKRGTVSSRKVKAVSIARIDFDKNTDIILRANRELDKKRQIIINGFENRLYGKFKLAKEFPEWMEVQSTHKFNREKNTAPEICNKATYTVDLSVIKSDGGGTQYSFLEAMDGGSVNILHKDWIIKGHVMKPGVNCLTIRDSNDLVNLLKGNENKSNLDRIVKNSDILLDKHRSDKVAKTLLENIL